MEVNLPLTLMED